MTILIVGAGISGLILAQHLQSKQIPFEIFDRDSALDARNGGWGLTLHWSLPALRSLLPDELWSKMLETIESTTDGVTAQFDNGTEYNGQLLIACDGARSRTRQILYPDAAMNPLPVQLLGASTLYSAEEMNSVQKINHYIFQGSHPDTDVFLFFSFLDTPSNFDDSGRDRYHVQIIVSWADTKGINIPSRNSDRIALMKKLSDNWSEPFKSLVQKLPVDTEARSIRIEDWMFQLGRETCAPSVSHWWGDSAHTMTMFRDEGANNAIVDVLDLVKRVDLEKPKYDNQERELPYFLLMVLTILDP
ncbi:hypothetical protein N7481_013501 [Penicillium waksmanii]|uniref:uncharacterized protein n=1 Tax=Penicillium waksmanii TaxID=69791 RepID=UPI002548C183|nr:uncharacterized protein N7481_013501 [Penicillium waksmanii]KAJ5963196.1 hypothetical protein N7481_013501 [Penicillium waksmanii]